MKTIEIDFENNDKGYMEKKIKELCEHVAVLKHNLNNESEIKTEFLGHISSIKKKILNDLSLLPFDKRKEKFFVMDDFKNLVGIEAVDIALDDMVNRGDIYKIKDKEGDINKDRYFWV